MKKVIKMLSILLLLFAVNALILTGCGASNSSSGKMRRAETDVTTDVNEPADYDLNDVVVNL